MKKGTFNFFINRLFQAVPVLLGISIISFFVMSLAPGDPTAIFINPRIAPEQIARIKANFGLNRPVLERYWFWLEHVLRGDFGYSLVNGQPVGRLIWERLPATLLLTGTSFLITFFLAVFLGVVSAVKKNSWFDKLVTFFTFLGFSLPSFWLGLVLILVF